MSRLDRSGFFGQLQGTNGFQYPQCAERIGIGGIFRRLETDLYMALGGQVVNFVRRNSLDQPHNIAAIGQVTIMHEEIDIFVMWVGVNIVNAMRIERRGAPFHAVDCVTFFQQKSREICAILPGHAGY